MLSELTREVQVSEELAVAVLENKLEAEEKTAAVEAELVDCEVDAGLAIFFSLTRTLGE